MIILLYTGDSINTWNINQNISLHDIICALLFVSEFLLLHLYLYQDRIDWGHRKSGNFLIGKLIT